MSHDLDEVIPGGGPHEDDSVDLPEDSDPKDIETVPAPVDREPRPRGEVPSYCYGYAGEPQGMGQMLTITQLMTKATVARLHPEFRRRVFALMEFADSQGVPLGIGTGWRVQPVGKPGFAPPGNSNHEGFPCKGGADSVAADMVPAPSMDWMQANVGRFGLKTFLHVNNEPWHLQPIEIPNSRKRRSEPWALAPFSLPGNAQPSRLKETDPSLPPYVLDALDQRPPRMPNHTLDVGSNGNEVALLQVVLRRWHQADAAVPDPGKPDGEFGPRTAQSLMALQTIHLGVAGDGRYDPVSHLKLQALSNCLAALG